MTTKNPNIRQPKHDPLSQLEGMSAAEEYLEDAILVAFDGCHKIYLAMDEEQAQFFRAEYPHVVERDYESMNEAIINWYEDSCSLRFINAVYTDELDPNAGFISLIEQFAS